MEIKAEDKEKLKKLEGLSKSLTEIMSTLGADSLNKRLKLIAKYVARILNAEVAEVLLVKRPGFLSSEASYGDHTGKYGTGKEFAIHSEPRTGLTGHIAFEGKLFNAHGDALRKHPAVRARRSRQCFSLLAIPLKKKERKGEKLIGLLRVENKKGPNNSALPSIGFSIVDEWILNIFAEAIVVAIENAKLIAQQHEQRDYLARLIASSPEGIIAIDEKGNVTLLNERSETILGYTSGEVINQIHVTELYETPRKAREVSRLLHQSRDGRVANHKTKLRGNDKQIIPIRLSATWMYDANGQRIGSVGYFEDLRNIEERERHFQFLLNASNTIAQVKSINEGLQRLTKLVVSSITSTFCRILLLDATRRFLVTRAAYPTMREHAMLMWQPGLDQLIPISDWPGLPQLLEEGKSKLFTYKDKPAKPRLLKLSRRLQLEKVIESLLLVPLKLDNEVVGLLDVGELRHPGRNAFTPEKINLAKTIATQATILIDRIRLQEDTKLNKSLLSALDEALENIRTEKDPPKLLHEFLRLAAELMGCKAGGVCINNAESKQLELTVIYQLDEKLKGRKLAYTEGLIGYVMRKRETQIIRDYSKWNKREAIFEPYQFSTMVGVPLIKDGKVEAVMFVADSTGRAKFTAADLLLLERFVERASVALHTSQLLSSKRRMFDQLAILQEISNYIQSSRDLDEVMRLVLTGVTAGYGLGFNRAALLLLNEGKHCLEGRMGIGHLDEREARKAWEDSHKQGLYNFERFLDAMKKRSLPETPIGKDIDKLHLPIVTKNPDAFSSAVRSRQSRLITSEKLDYLPEKFLKSFQPTSEVLLVPLISREKVIGLLVTDNKFTQSPITNDDVNSLSAFANTAAISIDNFNLFQMTRFGMDKLRSSFVASTALISSRDPIVVLQDIVNRMHLDANASWVSLVLIDETEQIRKPTITSGAEGQPDVADVLRPDGNSQQVMKTGRALPIDDTHDAQYNFNQKMLKQSNVAAALCLPLSLHGVNFGVIWMHYDKPRAFSQPEIDAWQLYANHAAIAYDTARRMRELSNMREAAETLAKITDSEEVARQIVRSAREVLQAEVAVFWYYDHARGMFIASKSVADGIPEEIWKNFRYRGPHPNGTSYMVMAKKIIEISDTKKESAYLGDSTRELLEAIGTRRFLGVALSLGRDNLGVLYLDYKQPRKFSKEEREAARAFANHATLALKRAKLLEQVNNARNTAKVVAKVTTLRKLKRTLALIVKGTKDALDCDVVTLYVYDSNRAELNQEPVVSDSVYYPDLTRLLPAVQPDSVVAQALKRRNLWVIPNTANHPAFSESPFVRREQILSCVATPLIVDKVKVGVMFVNYRSPHRFSETERTNIELFASQAAVAISNAQLFEQEQKRSRALEALHVGSQEVTRSLDEKKILGRIAEQAWRIANSQDQPANFADIRLVRNGRVYLEAVYPKNIMLQTGGKLKAVIDLQKGLNGRLGIIGRAIKRKTSQSVPDVKSDAEEDYIEFHPSTRSELVVPIMIGDEVSGIINVEHPCTNAFDEKDIDTFESLAAQASNAIQNARRYADLQHTIELLKAKTSLAWMGLASSVWRHDIDRYLSTLEDQLAIMRSMLRQKAPITMLNKYMGKAQEAIRKIKQKPITVPAFIGKGVPPQRICRLIDERLEKLQKREPYRSVRYVPAHAPINGATVKVNLYWLQQALDHLIDNAVEAMRWSRKKELTITVRQENRRLEIRMTDTGKGMPKKVRQQVLVGPVEKPRKAKGLGYGLLQAQAIIQRYGGNIRADETSSKGTTMTIWLPLEMETTIVN